jgi:osmotically-inducible protein OsmY
VAERLQTALEQLDLPAVTSISVYVKDGLVTIQGLVTSKKELGFISDIASRVDGVRHVVTHLQVVSPKVIQELEAA